MSDKIWRAYSGNDPDTSLFVPPDKPEQYDDILKLTHANDVWVGNTEIPAGRENAIDIVDCKDVYIDACSIGGPWRDAGVADVTIKGASAGVTFRNCVFLSQKNLELGQFDNYWTPGRKPTREVKLLNCNAGPYPVVVTCWDSTPPVGINTNLKVKRIPKWIWFPYFCFRYVWIRLFEGVSWKQPVTAEVKP